MHTKPVKNISILIMSGILFFAPSTAGWGTMLTMQRKVSNARAQKKPEGRLAVFTAAGKGDARALKALIASGANIQESDKGGNSPLHIAARNGKLDCVRILIRAHAIVNLRSHDIGATPLFLSVLSNNTAVVRLLLESGAKKELKADSGSTPLDLAKHLRYSEIIKLLR